MNIRKELCLDFFRLSNIICRINSSKIELLFAFYVCLSVWVLIYTTNVNSAHHTIQQKMYSNLEYASPSIAPDDWSPLKDGLWSSPIPIDDLWWPTIYLGHRKEKFIGLKIELYHPRMKINSLRWPSMVTKSN